MSRRTFLLQMSRRTFVPQGGLLAGSCPPPPPPPQQPSQLPPPEDAPPVIEEREEEIDLAALLGSEGRQNKPLICPPEFDGEGL